MKSNEELQSEIQDALKWEPLLAAAEIGVIVQDGVVTLTGLVDNFAKKSEAEYAAKSVAGVRAVVEKIEVKFNSQYHRDDVDIAKDVLDTLKSSWTVPDKDLKVKVEAGWVTLEGEVPWNYQKEAAKKAIQHLQGVIGVSNSIAIKSDIHDDIERQDIIDAIDRNWSIDDQNLRVDVAGNKVMLTGTVGSIYQKEEADRIAWKTPGVCSVENELDVIYSD